MSSYIVKPENIAKIANFIASVNFNAWTFELPETVTRAFYTCRDSYGCLDAKKICKYLAIENYMAVDSLYKKNSTPEEIEAFYEECISCLKNNYTKSPDWEDGRRVILKKHLQLYKTLGNYIYQIDSDATCNGAIYKSLTDLYNAMARWIISNNELYQDCSWS